MEKWKKKENLLHKKKKEIEYVNLLTSSLFFLFVSCLWEKNCQLTKSTGICLGYTKLSFYFYVIYVVLSR